jgi:hypothetical protein
MIRPRLCDVQITAEKEAAEAIITKERNRIHAAGESISRGTERVGRKEGTKRTERTEGTELK